jgi:carbamoyl-phosphate synthase large subunit
MKRILITGAGGAASLNLTRSLRLADEPFHLVGVDSNRYNLARAETDERYLGPKAHEDDYVPVLRDIIASTGAELVVAQPDVEIAVLSERRGELGARTYWPDPRTVRDCQDKYVTYRLWQRAGLRVPETRMIRTPADLSKALHTYGDIWLRAIQGAAGRGSFHTSDLDQATAWMDFNRGWGSFSAAEYLGPESVTWQSIWHEGELVVAQGRRRLYWELANRAPSGITGITGAGVTIRDEQVDDIAERAVHAVDERPHGIFSVDLTYDRTGVPNPTEINIGRFFTTHLFFTVAGLNMPLIMVRLAYGEEPPPIERRRNPLPEGLAWIRGMDKEPVLTTLAELEAMERDLSKRRSGLVQPTAV